MEVLVEIKTPDGEALNVSRRLSGHLLPRRVKYTTYTNAANNIIYWEITGQVRDILKINKNVAAYETIMRGALDTSMVKKQIGKSLSVEDQNALREMLIDQTKLTIVRQSTIESDVSTGLSWWERTKLKLFKL